jgi:hypothetical protein
MKNVPKPFDNPEGEDEQRQPDIIQVEAVLCRVDDRRDIAEREAVFAIGEAETREVNPGHFGDRQCEDREVDAAQP